MAHKLIYKAYTKNLSLVPLEIYCFAIVLVVSRKYIKKPSITVIPN